MDLGLQDKVAIVMAASKGLGRACATALAAEGARVTIGARGTQALEKTAQEIQKATRSRVLAVPMGRVGITEELGALVAFLASQQAAYITGTTIQVDGGLVRSLL